MEIACPGTIVSGMRHRIVQSVSRRELERTVQALANEGWRAVGESTISAPDDLRDAPHWVRVLYQSPTPVPMEILRISPPADSRFSEDESGD